MSADLTILTCSIPGRSAMLAEAIASVANQTLLPRRHLVSVDYEGIGLAAHSNALGAQVETGWMMYLADDDLLDATFVETTMMVAEELGHPAVVWPYCRGEMWAGYNQPYSHRQLLTESTVAGYAVFSTELFARAGAFWPEEGQDWHLWQRMAELGATFQAIPEPLYEYRAHASNISRNLGSVKW